MFNYKRKKKKKFSRLCFLRGNAVGVPTLTRKDEERKLKKQNKTKCENSFYQVTIGDGGILCADL